MTAAGLDKGARLRAGVIGAGIAGLSAAIALRRAGWDVEIFEKSRFKNEVGAAVVVGCNGTRVLQRFGADVDAWGATDNLQVSTVYRRSLGHVAWLATRKSMLTFFEVRNPRGDTLEPALVDSFAGVVAEYGSRWLFFHRQDLHSGLREMVQDAATAEAPPARIHLGSPVYDIDCDAGSFRLADGREIRKDLLIIASGVHCRFVENIVGRPNPVVKTGRTVYRCLVPVSEVMKDPLTAQLFENQPPGLLGAKIPGVDVVCGSFPCRNSTLLNLVYLHATKPEHMTNDDWNSPASIEEVDVVTTAFHPAIRSLPRKATDIKAYNMITREELPTFTRGRAVLIGDAAHPMLTHHAQGASMAIETAGALEIFFDQQRIASNDIVERLQKFSAFRQPRCVTTQILSNAQPGPADYPNTLKRVRKYYDGPLPSATSRLWSKNFRDFFFSYDVFEQASAFLTRNGC